MSTTRGQPEPVPTREERVEAIGRSVIGGHPQAQVRRILLYVTLFAFMGASLWVPGLIVAALVAAVFLLATDGDL